MEHEGRMARDEEFARWYRAHHSRIRNLCTRILHDHAAAEDMAQEALLRAWTRRDQMREEDLGAWLSVVARNLCVSALRRDGRIIPTEELPERADHGADPALEVGRRESRLHVRRALARLGDRHRRVIYLNEVRELDYNEIGSQLGLTAEGARAIAFRARRVLREHLAAVGEGFSGVLVGIRVRLRDFRMRVRETFRSVEPGVSPAMQSGLNAILAVGLVLTTGAGSAIVSEAASSLPASIAAVAPSIGGGAPRGIAQGPELASETDVSGGRERPGRVEGPLVPGTPLDARPLDPGDHSTKISFWVNGKEYVVFEGHPTQGDGLDGLYRTEDVVTGALCRVPAACALLGGELL